MSYTLTRCKKSPQEKQEHLVCNCSRDGFHTPFISHGLGCPNYFYPWQSCQQQIDTSLTLNESNVNPNQSFTSSQPNAINECYLYHKSHRQNSYSCQFWPREISLAGMRHTEAYSTGHHFVALTGVHPHPFPSAIMWNGSLISNMILLYCFDGMKTTKYFP